MKETIQDIGFSNNSAIPDNYLHLPESVNRTWMDKHGK
jgi:hypothetical protein